MIDVERAVSRPAGDIEAAAEVELGKRQADGGGDLAGMSHGHAVHLRQRFRIEALRAGEHVQAAPVDAGFEQAVNQYGYAIGIDPEWAWPAADADPAVLDRERRGHPQPGLSLDTQNLAAGHQSGRVGLPFQAGALD